MILFLSSLQKRGKERNRLDYEKKTILSETDSEKDNESPEDKLAKLTDLKD